MARTSNELFYYKKKPYGMHNLELIPIPSDPDVPINPCSLCPDGYDCVNGECIKEEGGTTTKVVPGIITPSTQSTIKTVGTELTVDDGTEEDCVVFHQIISGVNVYPAGYISGVDQQSGGRYYISPKCYMGVIFEAIIDDASDVNNYITFGFGYYQDSIISPEAVDKRKYRFTLTPGGGYLIEYADLYDDTHYNPYKTLEKGNMASNAASDWTAEDIDNAWMVVGVHGSGAKILSTSVVDSGYIPVVLDASSIVPNVLSGSLSQTYTGQSVQGTTTDSEGKTVRTKTFFTFDNGVDYDGIKYENGQLTYTNQPVSTPYTNISSDEYCYGYQDITFTQIETSVSIMFHTWVDNDERIRQGPILVQVVGGNAIDPATGIVGGYTYHGLRVVVEEDKNKGEITCNVYSAGGLYYFTRLFRLNTSVHREWYISVAEGTTTISNFTSGIKACNHSSGGYVEEVYVDNP